MLDVGSEVGEEVGYTCIIYYIIISYTFVGIAALREEYISIHIELRPSFKTSSMRLESNSDA